MVTDAAPSEFGSRLRRLRERRGMSQPVLAGMTDISQRKLSDIEQGAREARFSAREWVALSEALGISLHELMGIKEPGARFAHLEVFSDNLTDSDIETLTGMARQLASARTAALPARDDLPFWSDLTPQEQAAYARIEDLARRGSRLRQAPPSKPRAGRSDGTGTGRSGGGRRPGGAARA